MKGPMAPVLTIFKDDLSLDIKGIRDNLKTSLKAGMGDEAGMFLAVGAGGEFPSLRTDERQKVAKAVVDQVSGEAPVFVGVQHTNPVVSLELAQHAEKIGAYGVQASPPYYYAPSESDVYDYFRAINDCISIPIMIYNTFWEGFHISSDLLARLAGLKNVCCVKWSAPSVFEYKKAYTICGEDLVFIDNTASPIVGHVLGASGFISHEANFWPEHELELFSLMESGDYDKAKAMIAKLNQPFYEFRTEIGPKKGGEAHVIKAAMDIAGLNGGRTRPPTAQLDEAEIEKLKGVLEKAEVPSR